MKKKGILIPVILLTFTILLSFANKIEAVENTYQSEAEEKKRKEMLETWRLLPCQDYFMDQKEEYQKVLDEFYSRKTNFELIISETEGIGYEEEMSYYLLGENWKKKLENIPDSEFLEEYRDFFLVYGFKEDKSIRLDESLYQQVVENSQLHGVLNTLGKEDQVASATFYKDYVIFNVAGPFFKEGVSADYVYMDKKTSDLDFFSENLWIDDHWFVYIPHIFEEYKEYLNFINRQNTMNCLGDSDFHIETYEEYKELLIRRGW